MSKMVAANCWSETLYPKIKRAEDFSPDQFYKSQVRVELRIFLDLNVIFFC